MGGISEWRADPEESNVYGVAMSAFSKDDLIGMKLLKCEVQRNC